MATRFRVSDVEAARAPVGAVPTDQALKVVLNGTPEAFASLGPLARAVGPNALLSAVHLAFDQQYAADAHVNSYYLTDLGPVLEQYGNRGYRLAQLEAALHAGRLHLATHALGLGAVGSTSFDDEVVDFFSPRAAAASFMFVTVFGARRRRG